MSITTYKSQTPPALEIC